MRKNRLFANTLMLYGMTGANYLLGLIALPYLTRVLGARLYGRIGLGTAFASYVQLFLDFGFVLSGTALVVRAGRDKKELSAALSAVTWCRLILLGVSFLAAVGLCLWVPPFKEDGRLYLLFWAYMAVSSLIPNFLFRGMEQMGPITCGTLLTKLIFVLGIFTFVKEDSEYWLVPVFYLAGAFAALLFAGLYVRMRLGLELVKISLTVVKATFAQSRQFFFSRLAAAVCGGMNTLILGVLYPDTEALGFYSAAERLIAAGKAGMTPVSDSLYPYMMREGRMGLAGKVMVMGECVCLAVCAVAFIFAQPICRVLLGEEYAGAAGILRCMLPQLLFVFPSYILAFPVLTPLGMVKWANTSVAAGALVQLAGGGMLWIAGKLCVYELCILTCVTEGVVLGIRVWAAVRGLRGGLAELLHKRKEQKGERH